MGQIKPYLAFAFKVAVAIFIINMILGAIEAFAKIPVRKYIFAPWFTFFPSTAPTTP